ncbi:hypothetical protein Golomagni_08045, partial [Golovinomyces magnicellulatus]
MGQLIEHPPQQAVMDEYLQSLPSMNLEPLWDKLGSMVPASPNPVSVPFIWKYNKVLPYLSKAGHLVPEEEAERRVLMLVNPAMKIQNGCTDKFRGAIHYGHHIRWATACESRRNSTSTSPLEGKKLPLTRGDVVVTPSWHWHDHGNESDSPVIWLDALNLPLFTYARVNFAEGYAEKRYPSVLGDTADWLHPWSKAKNALDNDGSSHVIYHYTYGDGKPLSTTLGVQAEKIQAGTETTIVQDASSFLYHCYEGQGRTVVMPPNGDTQIIHWASRDTFAIPAWSKIQHFNESSEPAYLVAIHDG